MKLKATQLENNVPIISNIDPEWEIEDSSNSKKKKPPVSFRLIPPTGCWSVNDLFIARF